MATLDLVVLVSGSGTNLQAILDAIEGASEARSPDPNSRLAGANSPEADRSLDARVKLVVSNKPNVKALERAQKSGVPTKVLAHKDFSSRESYDAALVELVRGAFDGSSHGWIVLAGFMRILTPTFIDAFASRIVNIHPSLLPSFPGTHAQKQALDHGVRVTGCTVHLVDAGTDTGRILAQAAVPVLDGDDEDTLAARILVREHQVLPSVLRWISEGKLEIVDGRPRYRDVVPVLGVETT
jgi:phosphoribosylglycinamide formyltransferase-1